MPEATDAATEEDAPPGDSAGRSPALLEPTPATPARRGIARREPVPWVLGAMVVGWSALFITLGRIRHARFATLSFDLGIYDQAVWLMSRFHDPFVTYDILVAERVQTPARSD
jgi:hypothetical protein